MSRSVADCSAVVVVITEKILRHILLFLSQEYTMGWELGRMEVCAVNPGGAEMLLLFFVYHTSTFTVSLE